MRKTLRLSTLSDKATFKLQRNAAWARNIDYWLQGPLRHVADIGDTIASRTAQLCQNCGRDRPIIIDMGFGSGWLLRALLQRQLDFVYIGLDCTIAFIENARDEFRALQNVSFELIDIEEPCGKEFEADIVVNAFNFFELCDLPQAFRNVHQFLRPGGALQLATIDKTYLLLAHSRNWSEYITLLRDYQNLSGVKYFFQRIDLGDAISETLEYPSVLYSTEDYLSCANVVGLHLDFYKEYPFTAAVVPKIYCYYEFSRPAA